MQDLTITDLERYDGHWQAIVQVAQQVELVNRKHGSWQLERDLGDQCWEQRDINPTIAAELQKRIKKLEKQQQRAA